MKGTPSYRLFTIAWLGIFICLFSPLQAMPNDVPDRTFKLARQKATRYQLLEKITELSGFFFIYDSSIIDDEAIVSITPGEYTLRNAIYTITGNRELNLRVVGNHILIELPKNSPTPGFSSQTSWFTVKGRVTDNYTQEGIPSVSIQLAGTSSGTITNLNGEFRIHIPDSLIDGHLLFSHIGYEPLQIENHILKNGTHQFVLEPKVIPLQEVVVRLLNPTRLINEMLEKRQQNYATAPVYLTSFYREGVEKRKNLITLTEGVFKIYKSPLESSQTDQVKLLKMRQYRNTGEKDTIITKFKSGIQTCLLLDVVKNLPDFLEIDNPENPYIYAHSDITVIDNRLANVISFEQHPTKKEPLYKGEIFIDSENDALLQIKFQINPTYVEKASSMFVEKKSKGINIKTRTITYTVSYKYWNGTYYINHIRGDLHFNIRKKRQLFSTQLHTWFEMMTGRIEDEEVHRFTRKETIPQTSIFSETKYQYDPSFWGNFNVILPEEELYEALSRITTKLEEKRGE